MMLMELLALFDIVVNATLCDANPIVACFVLLVLAGTLLHLCLSHQGGRGASACGVLSLGLEVLLVMLWLLMVLVLTI